LSLHKLVKSILEHLSAIERFLLVIDQFEELFTLTQEGGERRRFMQELLDASEKGALRRPPSFVLLLTLRADFMGQALSYRPFADALQDGSLMLGPMTRAELKRAIEKPAELQGAAFETGLVERLLDDVGDEPGNLPSLEFALTLLWEKMDVGWMTHDIYDEIGRVDGALARYAGEIYAGLDAQGQNESRKAFIQLIQPGRGTEDTRRMATRDELVSVDWSLIQYLADKRLIVTSRNEAGVETVEVVHEALIQSWDQLREWIDADRAFRNWQEGLRGNLRQWKGTGQDKGALLRGATLAQAEEWLVNRSEDLSPAEAAYIEAGLERDRMIHDRRTRRSRFIFSGLAIGLVVALILSVLALSQRNSAIAESNARATQQVIAEDERARAENAVIEIADQKNLIETQARDAVARNLTSAAHDVLNFNPQLGLLLVLEAAKKTYLEQGTILPEVQTALYEHISDASRLVNTIPPQRFGLPYIHFAVDSSRLIAHYFASETDPLLFPNRTTTLVMDVYDGTVLHELPAGIVADAWPSTPFIGIVEPTEDELILNLWNPIDGVLRQSIHLSIPKNAKVGDLDALVLNPEATRLYADWLNGYITQVWDIEAGAETNSQGLVEIGERKAPWILLEVPFFKVGVPSYTTVSADGTELYQVYPRNRRASFIVRNAETLELLRDPSHGYGFLRTDHESMASISPDGNLLGVMSHDIMLIDNFESNEELNRLISSPDSPFIAFSFSPDSTLLAIVDADGTIKVWDLARLVDDHLIRPIITLTSPGSLIHHIKFSPDGQWLATASNDGAIKIWDINPGKSLTLAMIRQDFTGDEEAAVSIALNPMGNRMAAAGLNGFAAVYDLDSAERLLILGDIRSGPVEQIDYSPNGSTIATCRYDGPFQIWDADSGIELFRLEDYTEGACSFSFRSDGRSVFLGFLKNGYGWHHELALPRLESGTLIEAVPLRADDWLRPIEGALTSVAYDDGSSSLAVISDIGELKIWNVDAAVGSGDQLTSFPLVHEKGGYLEALVDLSNEFLVVSMIDGSVKILDYETFQFVGSIAAHEGKITAAAFSQDGSQLATSGQDRAIKVWDMPSGDSFLRLPDQDAAITDLAFSSDGTHLYAAGEDGTIRLFILDIDELIELAQSNVTRSFTTEECQQYLYTETCQAPD
jgi:WD40 repeat protein